MTAFRAICVCYALVVAVSLALRAWLINENRRREQREWVVGGAEVETEFEAAGDDTHASTDETPDSSNVAVPRAFMASATTAGATDCPGHDDERLGNDPEIGTPGSSGFGYEPRSGSRLLAPVQAAVGSAAAEPEAELDNNRGATNMNHSTRVPYGSGDRIDNTGQDRNKGGVGNVCSVSDTRTSLTSEEARPIPISMIMADPSRANGAEDENWDEDEEEDLTDMRMRGFRYRY